MSDDWMDELREAGGALRPTGSARGQVLDRVRRSQRRRNAAVTAGAVVAVAAVGVGTAIGSGVLQSGDSGPASSDPASSGPVSPNLTPTESSTSLWEEPEPGDCPTLNKVFDPDAAPPFPDRAQQEATVERVQNSEFGEFQVRHASASPLGVVALVTGDEAQARQVLGAEFGIRLVGNWDPSYTEADIPLGDLPAFLVDQLVGWELDPVVSWVRRESRGVPGSAGVALWRSAGAVLLQWKEPVPAEIRALAGVRANGVLVVVEGVRYSDRDLQGATARVWDAFRAGDVQGNLTMTTGCGDSSGIVVGISPKSLGDRKEELERQLAPIAGVPVTVVPEGPIVGL